MVGGGGGPAPGIDPHWLAAFACELAHAIAHASITIMESSLDMLRAVFSPPVVTALVANAVAAVAEGATAKEQLAQAGAFEAALGDQTAQNSDDWGATAVATFPSAESPLNSLDPSKRAQLGVAMSSQTPIESPFAPLASVPSTVTATVTASFSTQSSSVSPPRRSPTNLAVEMLRRASLRSDTSALFAESAAVSPALSELEGYEDLLSEDAAEQIARRPSWCLDRARSRDSMAEGEAHGAGAAAAENHGDAALVGSPESKRSTTVLQKGSAGTEGGVTARDDSAGGPVTFGASRSSDPAPHAHPRSWHPCMPFDADDAGPASVPAAPGPAEGGPAAAPAGAEPRLSSLSRISEERSYSGPCSSRSLSSRLASLLSSQPSGLPSPAALHAAAAARALGWAQLWDLEFADPVVEQAFLMHLAPRQVASDSLAVCATVLSTAALAGLHPSGAELSSATAALPPAALLLLTALAAPPFAAARFPERWARLRAAALPPLRLMAAVALAAVLSHLRLAAFHPLGLLFWGLMYPLNLRTHVPLQALCLWGASAAAEAGAASPGARLHQLAVGFLAPTLIVYVVERHLRRRFEAQLRFQLATHS